MLPNSPSYGGGADSSPAWNHSTTSAACLPGPIRTIAASWDSAGSSLTNFHTPRPSKPSGTWIAMPGPRRTVPFAAGSTVEPGPSTTVNMSVGESSFCGLSRTK